MFERKNALALGSKLLTQGSRLSALGSRLSALGSRPRIRYQVQILKKDDEKHELNATSHKVWKVNLAELICFLEHDKKRKLNATFHEPERSIQLS